MSRYFVTHNSVSYDCGELTVILTSNTSQHLWLLWSAKTPYIRPIKDRRQNGTVPHQNNLSLEIQGDIEQEEPGNTTTHTFHLPWPTGAQQIWFYSINQGTGNIKATRSPLFAYELANTPLLYETWSTQPNGDLGWQVNSLPGGATLTAASPFGRVNIPASASGGISLDLSLNPTIQATTLCDLAISAEAYMTQDQPNAFLLLNLEFRDAFTGLLSRRDIYIKQSAFGCVAMFSDGQVLTPIFGFTQGTRLPMKTIYNAPGGPCGNTPFVTGDPILQAVAFSVTRAGPPNNLGATAFIVSRLQLSSLSGQLTDISGEWRNKRLAPFIP